MEKQLQELLQISASLYEKLTIQTEKDSRDEFIDEINNLLNLRGEVVSQLVELEFKFDKTIKLHQTLFELDKGIRERLSLALFEIKTDLKELNAAKKSEQQYTNPYGHVHSMDGMYYDRKK